MKELLAKLLERKNLSQEEAREMILWVMSEEAVPTQAAALLALLQAKGATIDEIVGAAHAMRERSEKIKAPSDRGQSIFFQSRPTVEKVGVVCV